MAMTTRLRAIIAFVKLNRLPRQNQNGFVSMTFGDRRSALMRDDADGTAAAAPSA
jgi:hypothetical protein